MMVKSENLIMFFLVVLVMPGLYFGSGIPLYLLIVFLALLSLKNKNFNPVNIFFILLFILPYSLNRTILNMNIGNYLDNSFIASFPLYFYLFSKYKSIFSNRKLSRVMYYAVIVLVTSNLIPGLLSLIGYGHAVRFTEFLNYFNSILVGLIAYSTFKDAISFQKFSILIVRLGLIVSIGGLVQYIIGFRIFSDGSFYQFARLTIIPYPDPVDLFPFFIVPLSFAISEYNYRRTSFSLITILSISLAGLLTWSRGGIITIIIVIILGIIMHWRKNGIKIIVLFASILLMLSLTQDYIGKNMNFHYDRLYNSSNLAARVMLWDKTIKAIADSPILGVGLGRGPEIVNSAAYSEGLASQYFYDYDITSGSKNTQTLHSFFLNWILSMGITIIPLIMIIYWKTISIFWNQYKYSRNMSMKAFASSAMISIIGLTFFYLQNTSTSYYYLFFFLGTAYSMAEGNAKLSKEGL
jgi:O-antigen ligase